MPLTSLRSARATKAVLPLWVLLVSAATLWPFWLAFATPSSGYAFMVRDMMIPARMPLNDLNEGLSSSAPRAIPQDTLLSVFLPPLSTVWIVAAMVLFCAMAGMVYTAWWVRRTVGASLPVQMVASLLLVWNPFTIERMLQGQWSIVVAMWLLPAIAYTSTFKQRGPMLFFLGIAAFTPTGWMLGGVIALACARSWLVAGAQLFLAAPWLLVTVFNGSDVSADSSSAAAFAARAESGVGTLGALMGLGGIWNSEAVPDSRTGWSAAIGVLLCALMVMGAWGAREIIRRHSGVLVVAALAIVVPFLLSTSAGVSVMGLLMDSVPGAGLLRDSQKFVALAVPGMTLLLARAVQVIAGWLNSGRWLVSSATGILIVLTVPALPAEMSPLKAQRLAPEWTQIVNAVSQPTHSSTLLLPPGNYRVQDGRPVVDPALKLLPGNPIDPGFLIVDDKLVDGDPTAIALLQDTMNGEDHLAENSVGWVLVDRDSIANGTDTSAMDQLLAQHQVVVKSDRYELYHIADATPHAHENSSLPIFLGVGLYWFIFGLGLCLSVWQIVLWRRKEFAPTPDQ
ncbi:hypothetical protein [Corynebacterium sp. ED61]|uniref:hypothetical protein n=1 Tax=Corynebacterium sp. ED61 TaxID=2211360 RepID=UPI00188477C6|nr:hypothetical protein [Corynebacterium sp. ED61]MBF0581723.1 hypothetical protein [Corynebacterium sp. ED61]